MMSVGNSSSPGMSQEQVQSLNVGIAEGYSKLELSAKGVVRLLDDGMQSTMIATANTSNEVPHSSEVSGISNTLPDPSNFLEYLISANCSFESYELCSNDSIYGNHTMNNTCIVCTNSINGNDMDPPKYWAFILVLFPLFTLFGNILVVLSVFKEKQLQSMTNYFIVSLAIADIMVAVLVMPLAVYVEAMNGIWTFENAALCDAWVAFDVTFCTASILNLTAISIDRFMAVTRPLSYARHKNNKRVYITIALVWLISIGIGSPIALGANESKDRKSDNCNFYNSDFLIWSSLGSFYIPCIAMIILYWRIFKVIHERAHKSLVSKRKLAPPTSNSCELLNETIESNDKNSVDVTSPLAAKETESKMNGLSDVIEEGSSTLTDEPNVTRSQTIESEIWVRRASFKEQANTKERVVITPLKSGFDSTQLHENIAQDEKPVMKKNLPKIRIPFIKKKGRRSPGQTIVYSGTDDGGEQKTVVKFSFHFPKRTKKGKKDMRSSRERKATKTLAIVLGAFLFCWVPFFTVNIIRAFCIRYQLTIAACQLDPVLAGTFLWLGYLNSFLNPVIYTIFNIEFRKAFRKLLEHPCK